jgi:hypothetical protein
MVFQMKSLQDVLDVIKEDNATNSEADNTAAQS